MKLDHISLIISKEENLEWYKNLGFIETKRIVRSYDVVSFMSSKDISLEIFIDASHPKRISNPEAYGLRSIAITVDSFNQLNIDTNNIKKDWFGRNNITINDPDGQPIQIFERDC